MREYIQCSHEQMLYKYKDLVYKLALVKTKNHHHTDDIFQEVFLRYVRFHPTFESEEHEKAWFIRVTLNCCNDFFKQQNKHIHDEIDQEIPVYDKVQEDSEVLQALNSLDENFREAIHLFYYEDLSIKEIASLTGKNENTVKSYLNRGRKALKEKLSKVVK